MFKQVSRFIQLALVLCLGVFPALLAGAQEEPEGLLFLEEVIVTAQKREQSLQEVGIAVTAFTGERLEQLGVVNSTDLASVTPGLNYTIPMRSPARSTFSCAAWA